MDIFEIAIWRFVMPPTVLFVLIVYSQKPFAVLEEPIFFDEFNLGPRGGMMVAPRVPFVVDELALLDKSFGVFICAVIELHGHAGYLPIVARPENRRRSMHAAQLTPWNERRPL